MRLRPPTIRTQLVALLLVPMISLAALWTYSSFTTVRGAVALIHVTATYRYYGIPTEGLTLALQQERRAAVEYVASGGAPGTAQTLHALERTTDRRVAALRARVHDNEAAAPLTRDQWDRVTGLLSVLDYLPHLRSQVDVRTSNWSDILSRYSWMIDPEFRLRTSLTALPAGQLAHEGSVVVELARARELLSREDAMVTGARAAGGMTDGQYRDFIGTMDGRKLLHQIYAPELPPDEGSRLDDFEDGNATWSLNSMEEAARTSNAMTATDDVPAGVWRRTADTALDELAAIDSEAAQQVTEQAHGTGMSVLVQAAAVSFAGLALVVASLLISLRISRRIAARLTALRDAAEELTVRRLPEIMRRLREGEPVGDLEDVAPDRRSALRLGDDEIGQVGRAFLVAQRAAIQAAVEQARLRRGVSSVFTTLARRSQVLLHRQLTLLDAMERRTEDPDELADLFRLDHMTTRMRRHSEGLLILSGNTPGRAWRRPVRMTRVVRSAVGEVEDYRRVSVRRMPQVALVGAAVADVVHLLAELIENATAFSPPDSEVVVRGTEADGGFVVEIEDRGLGMSPERLEQSAAEIEESARGADLPETDRLGLFTVGRLAARHSVRVTLRRVEPNGTVAVVRLPAELLVPSDESEDTGEQRLVPPHRPATAPKPAVVAAAAPGPQRAVVTLPAAGTPAPPAPPTTERGLPRRVRRASLAQRAKDEPVTHDRANEDRSAGCDAHNGERSPEAARSTMAAYARGLARGRAWTAATESRQEDGGSP